MNIMSFLYVFLCILKFENDLPKKREDDERPKVKSIFEGISEKQLVKVL